MAGIKQPIMDVVKQLATLQVVNGDSNTVQLYTDIWNNQPEYEEGGHYIDYPKPAAFVEVINKAEYKEIGIGFRSCDIGFRIHLVNEFLNGEGSFERNLAIFDLRDQVIALLSFFQPTACGPMVSTGEEQDYKHKNIYHFILDFITNFTDSRGSQYDPDAGKYIYTTPPIGLEVDITDPRQI